MARWEPDARARLRRAALELYAEQGFDETTVAEIAERAGVTERTFFRHFADKREVLFVDSAEHLQTLADVIVAAPESVGPLDAVVDAIVEASSGFQYEISQPRSVVIAATPSLLERELLKLASWGNAAADALRKRGVPGPTADLAAQAAIAVFRTGFEQWTSGDGSTPLADHIRAARTDLKAAVSGP